MTLQIQLKLFNALKPQPNIGTLLTMVFLFCLQPINSEARDDLSMYVGEVKVLEIKGIERVAIGNPKVASNTILSKGQLVVLADALGVTTMHIWLKDGTEKDFDITVSEKQVLDSHQELVRLVADISGVSVEKIGDLSVVKGEISLHDRRRYERIMSRYKGVLDLVITRDNTSDVARLLEGVPGIMVQDVGGSPVITGEVSEEYEKMIQVIAGKYTNVMNLTRVHEAVAGKMVYMNVRILEVTKSLTENLGINWNVSGIPGPSLEFGWETNRNDATILNSGLANPFPQSIANSGNTSITRTTGYFGIATGIGSVLNLAETSGDAVVLAEPRLSTRSGGSADFLAGGEFPIPVTNSLGGSHVEFKKYGISLNIEPVIDDRENILAHVETEVSTIDTASAVQGIPGVLSRRTNTDVSLRAGQTLVIAGLVQDEVGKDYDNVKWLSEIPVLGPLFKSKNFHNKKTELVIFITPHIYDASSEINTASIKKGEEIEKRMDKIIEGNKLLE